MKHILRQKIRQKRKNHHASLKEKKDQKICTILEKLKEFRNAKSVLFFAPIKEEMEVDCIKLIKKYIQEKQCCFPRIKKEKNELIICHIKNLSNLKKGTFGILEPSINCEKIDIKKIDLIFVPGIAFDREGNRIGFGKGFYDRLLKKKKCPAIGLAYDFQIVQSIPGEKHDVKMDMIITEKEIITPSSLWQKSPLPERKK